MIYEFRTYTLHPRTMPEFIKRWVPIDRQAPDVFEARGLLVQQRSGRSIRSSTCWPYENALERSKIRAAVVKDKVWPPPTSEFIAEMKSEIFEPLPYSPPMLPSNDGPYFEMRSYTLPAGGIPDMAARWKEHLPGRTKLSPLTGVFTSDVGGLNSGCTYGPTRASTSAPSVPQESRGPTGFGHRRAASPRSSRRNKIVLAAPFSPIK